MKNEVQPLSKDRIWAIALAGAAASLPIASIRAGSPVMISRRRGSSIAVQCAISSSERPQPVQSRVPASISQMLMQGEEMGTVTSFPGSKAEAGRV